MNATFLFVLAAASAFRPASDPNSTRVLTVNGRPAARATQSLGISTPRVIGVERAGQYQLETVLPQGYGTQAQSQVWMNAWETYPSHAVPHHGNHAVGDARNYGGQAFATSYGTFSQGAWSAAMPWGSVDGTMRDNQYDIRVVMGPWWSGRDVRLVGVRAEIESQLPKVSREAAEFIRVRVLVTR